MKNQENRSAPVSQQYLKDPVPWGSIASTHVSLMTPPAHILEAALSDIKPTEVAYVIVMERRPRKEQTPSPPPAPKFRLVVEDDETDEPQEDTASPIRQVSSDDSSETTTDLVADEFVVVSEQLPRPAFRLVLEDDDDYENISPQPSLSETPTVIETMSESIKASESFSSSQLDILDTVMEESGEDSDDDETNPSDSPTDPTLASKILSQLAASETKSRKLELQLINSGMSVVTDDISYNVAKQKIAEIAARMNEIGDSSSEYYTLEQEMEKYSTAILMTDEYHREQQAAEQRWEVANAELNQAALLQIRRHLPVDIRLKTVEELFQTTHVPYELLKRFKRTNGITLLRVNPDAIERMHPSTLENMRVTGLTVSERRALYAHLQSTGEKWKQQANDAMTARKYAWFTMLKGNFREALNAHEAHLQEYRIVNEVCQCDRQRTCPVMADANLGYRVEGAGQPAEAEYEAMDIMLNKSFREENSTTVTIPKNDRRGELRKFYKGSMRDISEANVACESMEDLLESIQYGMLADAVNKQKPLLSDIKLTLHNIKRRPNNISDFETSLMEKVCKASIEFCDTVEVRLKEGESTSTIMGMDVKGTIIMTSAIRTLVDEIAESFFSHQESY